jgi:serine/threonine protein kinase
MNIRELAAGIEITDGSRIYTLEERLGEGRQGVCYRADFHGDEKVVKLMQSSDDLVARLRTRLFDLNLALGTRYNVFKIDPVTFAVVGDYYPGKNIRETLNENERLYSEDEVREFLLQMGRRWLGPLYSRRLIHHDIKPENIIVNDGVYSLIDFGGVRSLDSQSLSLSLTGEDIRSFYYSRFYGERSLQDDLYSLGKVAMFMLSGRDSSVLLVTDEEKDRRENGEAIETLKASAKMKSVIGRLLGVERVYGVPEEMVMDLEERSLIVPETRLVVPERGLVNLKPLSDRIFEIRGNFRDFYYHGVPNLKALDSSFTGELFEVLNLLSYSEVQFSGIQEKDPFWRSETVEIRELDLKNLFDSYFIFMRKFLPDSYETFFVAKPDTRGRSYFLLSQGDRYFDRSKLISLTNGESFFYSDWWFAKWEIRDNLKVLERALKVRK